MNMYSCSPSQAKEYICMCLEQGLVPMLQASPGVGKSAIVKQIAEEFKLKLIDLRLSMCDPADLQGLPHFENDKAIFHPYEMFPLKGDPIPEGFNGYLLFLDEFNSAPRSVIAAAYKIVLDHMVGNYELHPDCYIVCAGNRMEDKAIVNNIGTAMKSRLVHINMEPNLDDWIYQVAIPNEYDERIIAYLNMNPKRLNDFNPDTDDDTFSCPRTWEFTSKLIKGKELTNKFIPLLIGTLGPNAVDFVQFVKVFKNLPKIEDILKKPEQVDVPADTASKWAIVSTLSTNIKKYRNKIDKVTIYINKFDTSFKILFYRSILMAHSDLINEPSIREGITFISKYLYGKD